MIDICPSLCLSFWGLYCCCLCSLFTWDILDENYNTGHHLNVCCTNISNKYNELYKKVRRKRGYDRVELVIEEPEDLLPETGLDKEFHIKYDKPMETLYEMNEED